MRKLHFSIQLALRRSFISQFLVSPTFQGWSANLRKIGIRSSNSPHWDSPTSASKSCHTIMDMTIVTIQEYQVKSIQCNFKCNSMLVHRIHNAHSYLNVSGPKRPSIMWLQLQNCLHQCWTGLKLLSLLELIKLKSHVPGHYKMQFSPF